MPSQTGASLSPSSLPAQLPGLELSQALLRVNNDLSRYKALGQRFQSEFDNVVAQFEQLAGQTDLQAIQHLAHRLKGVAATLGAVTVAEIADEIEGLERFTDLPALLSQLSGALETLQQSIATVDVHSVVTGSSGSDTAEVAQKPLCLDTLASLLALGDSDAVAYLPQLISLSQQLPDNRALTQVIDMIESFDFDKALEHLQPLLEVRH